MVRREIASRIRHLTRSGYSRNKIQKTLGCQWKDILEVLGPDYKTRNRTPDIIQVNALLKQGLNRKEIREKLGVSHKTLLKVLPKIPRSPLNHTILPDLDSPAVWCSGCGHNVHLPCLFCLLKKSGKARQ